MEAGTALAGTEGELGIVEVVVGKREPLEPGLRMSLVTFLNTLFGTTARLNASLISASVMPLLCKNFLFLSSQLVSEVTVMRYLEKEPLEVLAETQWRSSPCSLESQQVELELEGPQEQGKPLQVPRLKMNNDF